MNAITDGQPSTRQSDELHILVVDDVEGNRAILCRRLERYGFRYSAAQSGQEALNMLETFTPDLILLDYMMPDLNGVDVLRILRDDRKTKNTPVIMVTARTEGSAVAQALDAGADDYVTKPIDFTVLKARIDNQLAKCLSSEHLRRANADLDNRIALRALELADAQDALQSEIFKRESIESMMPPSTPERSCPAAMEGPLWDSEIESALERIDKICRSLYAAVASGKSPNLALVAEARAQVTAIKQRGSSYAPRNSMENRDRRIETPSCGNARSG